MTLRILNFTAHPATHDEYLAGVIDLDYVMREKRKVYLRQLKRNPTADNIHDVAQYLAVQLRMYIDKYHPDIQHVWIDPSPYFAYNFVHELKESHLIPAFVTNPYRAVNPVKFIFL